MSAHRHLRFFPKEIGSSNGLGVLVWVRRLALELFRTCFEAGIGGCSQEQCAVWITKGVRRGRRPLHRLGEFWCEASGLAKSPQDGRSKLPRLHSCACGGLCCLCGKPAGQRPALPVRRIRGYWVGGSGRPPTWVWLRSWSMERSSSLMPRVKLGSLRRWFRADSGMFCSTPSFCFIICWRSQGI
jgi:hypothetical protein